jgi:DNA-binding transcriptional ArsR family regulator
MSVSLEPAQNLLYSLVLLTKAEKMEGLGDWVPRTAAALTPAERETNDLVIIGLYYTLVPERSWPSCPAYVEHRSRRDPVALRDKMLDVYASCPPLGHKGQQREAKPASVDIQAALASADAYVGFLRERFDADHLDEELEARAYTYVLDPPAMQDLIVSHLQKMWEKYLAPEWEQVKPMLQEAVTAFQQIDLSAMSKLEAAQLITGQTLAEEKWQRKLEHTERIIFVPSAHAGPYLGKIGSKGTLWMTFGARVPEGVPIHAPALSRAEIIMRLNALTDDNRLRILKLVSEEGEQSSQDIMRHLELSQSATSRHLKQLSASGYLFERRCDGAKCYELNPERVKNTLQAVSTFLLGN